MTPKRISYCTAVMGRLDHLKQTLPDNLKHTDEATEFVILNYSDTQGLDEWVMGFLAELSEADRAKVSYHIHTGASHFHHSHAKNIAHKLAKGDFLVNLDADNFLGPEAPSLVRASIHETDPKIVMHCPDLFGLVGLWRPIFEALGGYEEAMRGWGMEDYDLIARAKGWGCRSFPIALPGAYRIEHDDTTRMVNCGGEHKLLSLTRNRAIHFKNLREGKLIANVGRAWGVIAPSIPQAEG
jgi:hypothetical protein